MYVNVGGSGGSEKNFLFSFFEVDFSAILYTQLCITLVLPCMHIAQIAPVNDVITR